MTAVEPRELDELDITTTQNYIDGGFPWQAWDLLREFAPVYRYDRPGVPVNWVITRYEDCKTVLVHDEVFSNAGPILRLASEAGLAGLERFKQRQAERWGWDPDEPLDMVFLDRPEHLDMRLITMRKFTPAAMRRLEEHLAEMTRHFVEEFVATARQAAIDGGPYGDGTVNLVDALSISIPLAAITYLLGVPTDDWTDICRFTELIFPGTARRYALPGESDSDVRRRVGREFHDYVENLIAKRREQGPDGDDLATALVHATIDGEPLTDQQLHGYITLLIGAGNETTRNAITAGVQALLEHPDQLQRLAADPEGLNQTAVEEILRWSSPVVQFARTAVSDYELAGTQIKAGDTVTVWFPSANRDERQFDNPYSFDVGRDPNYHLAFGHGEHFCLGANLARWELRATFKELAPHLVNLEAAGPLVRHADLHVPAIHTFKVRWTGE